jgi:hypothetical protein
MANDRTAGMASEVLSLATLLSPVTLDQFFERYWEQNYLHIEGRAAGYYRRFLTAADLEQIVSNPDASCERCICRSERCPERAAQAQAGTNFAW